MTRFLIETEKVDARMVNDEHGLTFGEKGGLLDECGFLRNPRWVQGLKTLNDVANEQGAVIIAESGLGKSYIAREFANAKGAEDALFIDVQEYRGATEALVGALNGAGGKQYVCLDGLDEAPELAGAIARGFRTLPVSVKRLIFSRGIPELRQFTGRGGLPMYSLLPLTLGDVKSLAKISGVDGDSFLDEIATRNLGPICAKPLECVALLEMFKSGSGLRENGDDLRKHMIRRLCAENCENPHRYSSSATVSGEKCFSDSKKIALILKLSGLSVIRRMDEMGPVPGAVDFTQYGDLFDAERFNKILLRGLFLPIGNDRFRFAHITYFDYLAAQGLMESIGQPNWKEIVMSGDGRVYPQWENAVAWVAAKDDEIFDAVFARQPELLLNSDAAVSRKGPAELCRAILMRAAQMDYWSRQSSGIVLQFSKLVSPATMDVLRNALRSGENNCRDMAIDIIKRCGIRELTQDLVKLFCDDTEPCEIRKSAGYALQWMEIPAAELKMCKVVLEQARCSQGLKGLAFRMLWPYELTAKEMTPHLKTMRYSARDSYSMWITDDCPERLSVMSYADALDMVQWAATGFEDGDDVIHSLKDLKKKVFTYCFKKFDTIEMYDALAVIYEVFSARCESPIELTQDADDRKDYKCSEHEFNSCVDKRRGLAEAVVRRGHRDCARWVTCWSCELLGPQDMDFLEEKIKTEKDEVQLARWVQCLGYMQWHIRLPERTDYWDYLHKRFPATFKYTAKRTIAERMKVERQQNRRRLKMKARQLAQERSRKDSYARNLAKIKTSIAKGELGKYFYSFVNYCSGQQAESKTNEWGFHIRCSRVWDDLSSEEKNEIVVAAEDFLMHAKAPPRKHENEVYLAPFASFVLLQEVARQKLLRLPKTVWHEFRIETMQGGSVDKTESALGVLSEYCKMFRDDFMEALVEFLQYPRTEEWNFYLGHLNRIVGSDGELLRSVLRRLDANDLAEQKRFKLLDSFWGTSQSDVLTYLRMEDRYRRIDLLGSPSLSIFSLYAYPDRFGELLLRLGENVAGAKEWIVAVVGKEAYWHSSLSALLKMLSTEDLASFYLTIRKHFPLRNEPTHSGVFSPDALDNIYTFASHLLSCICDRKDSDLVTILERLVHALPEEQSLRDRLIRARKDALAVLCPIYDIQGIHLLLDEKNKAFVVNTPEALSKIVLAALEKYQVRLTGKRAPRVKLLWTQPKTPGAAMSHREEEDFSDDICDYLDLTLKTAIFNREVQLNRGRNGEKGARTDIWVDAISNDGNRKLTLCIEVKGSWNPSAKTAIPKQLVHKYLGEGGADAGILVLGWFDAPAPYESKNRWKTMALAREELNRQVAEERTQGNLVTAIVLDCSCGQKQ